MGRFVMIINNNLVTNKKPEFMRSGITDLDDILGGGIPMGYSILLSADPGAGKTTLATQISSYVSDTHKVLFVSNEESSDAIASRIDRLGGGNIDILASIDLYGDDLINIIKEGNYNLVIIDSIQSLKDHSTKAYSRGALEALKKLSHESRTTRQFSMIGISQVTKSGDVRGSKEIPHLFDVLVRILRVSDDVREIDIYKNRFGIESSFYQFMTAGGFSSYKNIELTESDALQLLAISQATSKRPWWRIF